MSIKPFTILGGACALALTGCGGGEGGVALIPAPPATPTPTPTTQEANVSIFQNPVVGTFGTAGVSATPTGSGSSMGFTALSKADTDQVHIRYSNGGYYEIQMPGSNWD